MLKASLLAVTLAFVATSANAAMTKADKARQAFASVSAGQTNQWNVNSPAPYSREANERFTW